MTTVGKTFGRSRSGPQTQRISADPTVDVVAHPDSKSQHLFVARLSGHVGINLDNAEWEKKVMNSWPKKCTFVVREILHTERAYIASLEHIILGYMMPLHGYLLSQGEGPNFIHTVFSNVNRLRQLHASLLEKLYSACGDPHEFADVFIETDFDQYQEYCTRYADAHLFLQKSMEENEKLKLFIIQCQHDLDHPLPLHTYLIKPVQRILKYQLMLQEMLKYIDEEDVIYTDVKEALDKMRKVAEEINTSFKKEGSSQMATPSVIARKRSKEIKSLQRSRSDQRRGTTPQNPRNDWDHTTELQRSREFEDSLTLLRSNKNSSFKQSKAAFNTLGPGRRPRALNDLITIFEATKPAQVLSPKLSSPKLPDPPFSPHSDNDKPEHVDEKMTSNTEPVLAQPTPPSVNGSTGRASPEINLSIPFKGRPPLTSQKSVPIVRQSMAEAQGENEKRNSLSLLHSTVESHILPEKRNAEKAELARKVNADSTSKEGESRVPLTVPQRPHTPLRSIKTRRPFPPPKPAGLHHLPDFQGKKCKIDIDSGSSPVVSIQQPPPNPPSTTLFPSMLKPVKNSTSVRLSVFARQDQVMQELRGGSSGPTHLLVHSAHTTMQGGGSSAVEGRRGVGRKIPLLPPLMTHKDLHPNRPSRNEALKPSLSADNILMAT